MIRVPETSTLQAVAEYVSLLQPIVWGGILWGWWSLKKIFVPRKECEECREELESSLVKKHARELAGLLANLPSTKDMQHISLSLARMEGDMKGLAAEVSGQGKAISRVERNVDILTDAHVEKK